MNRRRTEAAARRKDLVQRTAFVVTRDRRWFKDPRKRDLHHLLDWHDAMSFALYENLSRSQNFYEGMWANYRPWWTRLIYEPETCGSWNLVPRVGEYRWCLRWKYSR